MFSKNLHLDETFPERQLAAYLGSKVYYHLGDMNEALNLALESGKYFNLEYCEFKYSQITNPIQ